MEVLRILDEKKLEELVSNMDDRIRMHDYSKEQLLLLIEDYVTINFQGMKYQTKRITSAIRKESMESFFVCRIYIFLRESDWMGLIT